MPAAYPASVLAVAFVLHPPALVPELCGGPVAEFDDVRAACAVAVDRLIASGPDLVWIVGTGASERWYGAGDVGTLAGLGRPVRVELAGPAGPDASWLPLALTVGTWLLDQGGYAGERLALSVPANLADQQLRDLAEDFVGPGALMVVGDGSARRDPDAPGTFHPAAGPFDDAVVAALRAGHAAGLTALDPQVGVDVQSQGVGAWRLAGHVLRPARFAAEVLYGGAPFGVGYPVAVWTPLPP